MLGPALMNLLRTLAETPEAARTSEQQALFVELTSLLPPPAESVHGNEAIASIEGMGTLSVTRPKAAGGPKCDCCGQTRPRPVISGA